MQPTAVAVLASLLALLLSVGGPQPEVATVAASDPAAPVEHAFPALLSKTDYFADLGKLEMAPGFTHYRVNVAPWADGGFKQRFVRMPAGKAAKWTPDGAFDFPTGTVFVQNVLILPRDMKLRRLETRVIVVQDRGLAFGTYAWRPDQQDADFVERGGRIDIETETSYQRWDVTSTKKCSECHAVGAQPLLGLSTEQLNLEVDGKNQLATLAERGLLTGLPESHANLPRLADPRDESQSLEARARSYLDVNCSTCHRPGGNGSGVMDLRYDTPREDSGLGEYKEVMIDGKPFDSWIYLRMIYTDNMQMPSELTTSVDEAGAQLIRDWVESKKSH